MKRQRGSAIAGDDFRQRGEVDCHASPERQDVVHTDGNTRHQERDSARKHDDGCELPADRHVTKELHLSASSLGFTHNKFGHGQQPGAESEVSMLRGVDICLEAHPVSLPHEVDHSAILGEAGGIADRENICPG